MASVIRLRRLKLGDHDTYHWQGLRGAGDKVYRLERLLPLVEEKIVLPRGAYGYVAWIVCVLAVPWEVCLVLNILS